MALVVSWPISGQVQCHAELSHTRARARLGICSCVCIIHAERNPSSLFFLLLRQAAACLRIYVAALAAAARCARILDVYLRLLLLWWLQASSSLLVVSPFLTFPLRNGCCGERFHLPLHLSCSRSFFLLSRARGLLSRFALSALSLSLSLPHTRIYSSYIPHTCTRIYARGDDYSPLCRCARVGIYTCTLFHYYYKLALLSSASAGGSTHALVRLAPSFLSPSILSSPRRGRCIYRYIHNTYPVHGDPGAVLLLLLAASSGSCTRKHGSSDTARR